MSSQAKPSLSAAFTVPTVAASLGVNRDKILTLIKNGELIAINLSLSNRPRWRITQQALDAFLEARSSKRAPQRSTRRRRTTAKVEEEFF